nr:hypothetical protein [Tanacetum cinerariifolium]
MLADSAVTYSFVHSEARSWSIPSEDLYEEAAQQLFEQAPHSPEYVPRDHVPVFVPEFEHPKDLVPAKDEAPASLLPPGFLSPRIRPLSPRALMAEMNAIASSFYHSLHPSGTPPLLPLPLSTPSTSRRAGIPEADTPPWNRPLLATPRPGCEKDRAAMRAKIEVLRSEILAYEQEGIQTREALARSEAYYRALEARVVVQIMARTRRGQTPPPTNPNNPNNMTPEAVQTMTDQALLRNSCGGDGSHSGNGPNPRGNGCFECGDPGHFKRDCPKLKNKNGRNRNAQGWVYAVGNAERNGMLRETQTQMSLRNVAKVYNIGTGERKPYEGSLPKCTKCQRHHNGPCTQKCHKCNKVGHFARNCRSSDSANVANAQRDGKETPKGNGCFECGASRNFKRYCPTVKNKNRGNRNAQVWVYAVGNAEKNGNAPVNPDSNVVTGTFLLNNRYASILFDTGADRSFIYIAFSSLVNIDPIPLRSSYDVKLVDGKIVGIDTILRGCTVNFQNHAFNIDLMPVELGSFDVIIGMDWLRRCHAVIVCDEKLVQIPYRNETLTFRGNKSNNGRESRLTVISCSKV